ncbi:MAG: hypothetical protein IJL76_02110 [Bacilli bacterium]|nr:hypothetical protein [Bacilli bacterium]
MSKHSFIGFIVAFFVIIIVISLYYNLSAKDNVKPDFENDIVTPTVTNTPTPTDNSSSESSESTNNNSNENSNTNTYTYTNEFGSGDKTTTVSAIQSEQLSGFSGASNNVYYIDGNYDLYYLELTNLVKTKLASNVDHLINKGGQITAYYKHPHDVYEENSHVVYKALS